jgi:hypothetical protein
MYSVLEMPHKFKLFIDGEKAYQFGVAQILIKNGNNNY